MPQKPNPALVIGLGGTGQWVLTYLKKNLLETYQKIPDTVKFIAFDSTSSQSEARVPWQIDKVSKEEKTEVGNVTLDDSEFVYLGGNIQRICYEIAKENRHTHIGSWLQAQWYLQSVDSNAFDISGGAGMRRPFGRMAVFYDMSTGARKVYNKINTAITEVKAANKKGQPVEIYIISSLAGGTGSGMFIDIAHLTRIIALNNQIKDLAVRGFLVLQNAFNSVIRVEQVLPNAFAAMRELERFMLVFERDYPIHYSEAVLPPVDVYHSVYRNKLFDNCYLLDATRREAPLDNVPPKLGVYPCVAECITAMLDAETGDAFSQHYKNVNQNIAKLQNEKTSVEGKALFSSLGAYTYILPVEDIIKRNTLKAVRELLEARLMKVLRSPNGAVLPDSTGNRELSSDPRSYARDFLLRQAAADKSQTLMFTQQVGRIVESGWMKTPQFINEIAMMGTEVLAWLTPPDKDEVISDTTNGIQAILNTSIVDEVPSSKVEKDDFVSAADRIARKIADLRDKQLGREEQGGRRTTGQLQEGLSKYQARNVLRFRGLMIDELTVLLNGSVNDAIVARSAKLPYVSEWLKWLIRELDEFIVFMREVIKERQRLADVALAREDAIRTRTIMYDTRNLTGLVDRVKGTAVRAQEYYIGAENYLLDQERQELLYQGVVSLGEAIQGVCVTAKASVDRWMQVLALGGPVDSNEPGVLSLIEGQQGQLQKQRDQQKQVKVYEFLTDDKYEDDLYRDTIDPQWREIMQKFKWSVQPIDNGFDIGLCFGDKPLFSERPRYTSASEQNRDILITGLQSYFSDIRRRRVVDRIAEARRPDGMANSMLQNCSPLIGYQANEQRLADSHNFICLDSGNQVRYVEDLSKGLKNNAPSAKENQVIGLSNQHRCIVLSTLDAITLQGTIPFQRAKQAYMNETGDRRLLHCFPAEINATYFEKRASIPAIQEPTRLLSPLLVSLIEDCDLFRHFVLACLHGVIVEEPSSTTPGMYQFTIHLSPGRNNGTTDKLTLSRPAYKPNLIEAIQNFVYPCIDTSISDKRIRSPMNQSEFIWLGAIKDEIALRVQSIRAGHEKVLEELTWAVHGAQLLDAESNIELTGLIRRFLYDNEYTIYSGDDMNASVSKLCNDNQALVGGKVNASKIAQLVMGVIEKLVSTSSGNSSYASVIRFYDAQINNLRNSLYPGLYSDDIAHDLAWMMRVVIFDEIEQLSYHHSVSIHDQQVVALMSSMRRWTDAPDSQFLNQAQKAAIEIGNLMDVSVQRLPSKNTILGQFVGFRLSGFIPLDNVILPSEIPLLMSRHNTLNSDEDIEDMHHLVTPKHLALLAIPATEHELYQLQRLISSKTKSTYELDVIVIGNRVLSQLARSREPQKELMKLILEHVNLTFVSPFVIDGPTPDNVFFGREAEIRMVKERIASANFAIVGNRKIGKTSVLKRLRREIAPQGIAPLFIDCQFVKNADGFLSQFGIQAGLHLPQHTPEGLQRVLIELRGKDKLPVLLLDEVDALLAHEREHGEALIAMLRTLTQAGTCHIVFCGSGGLVRQINDSSSPFYNFAQEIRLGYLTESAARMVITQPFSQMGIVFDDSDSVLKEIVTVTSGHPNLLQYLGRGLVQAANQHPQHLVARTDLDMLIASQDFVDYYLKTIFGEANSIEKLIVLLAPNEAFEPQYIRNATLNHNLRLSETDLEDSLRMLRVYSILEKNNKMYSLIPKRLKYILESTQEVEALIRQEIDKLHSCLLP